MAAPPLHPDLRAARFFPRSVTGPRRLRALRLATRLAPRLRERPGVEVVPLDGGATLRVHRPAAVPGPAPALLWVHGGGMVLGSAATEDDLCRRWADELGVVVASPDYRLAPEHPYPAPLEDCWEALTWLVDRPEVDASRVVVGGASAGGGLAAGLALLARERGVDLALQLLVYPMLDDRTGARTDVDARPLRLWSPGSNRFGWRCYLGGLSGDAVPAPAAPARAEDLSGLPPAWVGVGTLDLFHDEDVVYARRLRAAGVPCELEVVEGAYHGFDVVQRGAGVSRDFLAAQTAALRSALGT
ncbi:alpha/beta hydrolase [Pseudokineococcus basanitobsidens]|uniref:Alpha/beta hydrolase n=1 Tax=Pseudokineococcus basanitobsidens TaxID=1926649 RepID=A0ABU8RPE4_9ACTN